MSISFTCPACGYQMDIPDHYAGRDLFCTACKFRFAVPDSPAPSEPVVVGGAPRTDQLCLTCGAQSVAGATFCSTCGVPVGSLNPTGGLVKRPVIITVLAVFHFMGSAFMVLLALLMVAVAADEPALGILLAGFYLTFGGLSLACGIGLWKLRPWGRGLQIGLSIIGLLGIPVGTLISGLILYYLFRPEVKILFSGRTEAELSVSERAILAQRQGSNTGATVAIVVAVVVVMVFVTGIIAAIAIPNLFNAINRGRQKRSMADISIIATAVESYAVDYQAYPADLSSIDEFESYLVPEYLKELPQNDGWGTPLQIWTSQDGSAYEIVSLGRDAVPGDQSGGSTDHFDDDIVFRDGVFHQWPEGAGVR